MNYLYSKDKVVATKIRFTDPKHGYFTDANGYFWKTYDGGLSFENSRVTKENLNLTDLAILDKDNYAVVGEKGGIFRTADGGKNWIVLAMIPNNLKMAIQLLLIQVIHMYLLTKQEKH